MVINPLYVFSLPLSFRPSFSLSLCLFFFYLYVDQCFLYSFFLSFLYFFVSFVFIFFIYLSLFCIIQKHFEVIHKSNGIAIVEELILWHLWRLCVDRFSCKVIPWWLPWVPEPYDFTALSFESALITHSVPLAMLSCLLSLGTISSLFCLLMDISPTKEPPFHL